ncbi:MAG: MFS transporter [Actinomycetota bacterium]
MSSDSPILSADASGPSTEERRAFQRRTLGVLFASSIFGRASMSLGFVVAAVIMKDILGSSTWAGASTAAITVGTALSASALAAYMNRKGRRPGLTLGYVVATIGGIIAVVGAARLSLVPYLIGLALIGVGQGGTNLARYAAADLAEPSGRSKAISYVVFASTIGAVGGPALAGPAGDIGERFGYDELVGPFGFAALFFLLGGLVVWAGLRPDPLVVIGGTTEQRDAGATSDASFARSMRIIRANPMARLALIGLVISQAVMVMVMAMTPLHMEEHGHSIGIVGWVLSVHTAGMFAFAPIAGWASDRYGRVAVIAAGGAVLVAATALTALAGEAPAILMFPGLYLLGLGWSFGMVASSALLTESVPADDAVSAQGAADLVTSFASGAGALGSGLVFTMAGFHILSGIGIVASGLMMVAAFTRSRLSGSGPLVRPAG